MATGIASVRLLGADAGFWSLMPSFAVIGIGGGLTVPLTSSVLDAMPRDKAGVASGIFNASREVSGLLGITVIGAVLTAQGRRCCSAMADPRPTRSSAAIKPACCWRRAWWHSGGLAAFIGLRRPDVPVTPVPLQPTGAAPVTA